MFDDVSLHIERGDRIALVGPNGAGKSTLIRMLSAEEAPDSGTRTAGHNVVIEYFAQDEATRLDADARRSTRRWRRARRTEMVPGIRNILGGFLFSGDDVYKRVGVLSGGERTRLAVARMLLRPSNTLILDEPTNHLDLDSKDVLLDALADYGGTLIFVSHDRYFVERLATKIVEVGGGRALALSGNLQGISVAQAARATGNQGLRNHRTGTGNSRIRQSGARNEAAPKKKPDARREEPREGADPPRVTRGEEESGCRSAQTRTRRAGAAVAHRTRSKRASPRPNRPFASSSRRWPRPGFYDDRAAAQPLIDAAPGADVAGRRSDAPVGGTAEPP